MIFFFKFSFIFMLIVIRLNIFSFIIMGWGSMNKYTYLGCIRAISQVISYEILIIFLILYIMVLVRRFNLNDVLSFNTYKNLNSTFPLLFSWLYISFLIETHRAPFDLAESESELVSGFNTEYMAGPFAFIFIAEYGFILFFSFFLRILFVKNIDIVSVSFIILIVFLFLFTRCVYPRLRFDWLIILCWKYLIYVFVGLRLLEMIFLITF